jgi:hypothetical protein
MSIFGMDQRSANSYLGAERGKIAGDGGYAAPSDERTGA